MGHWPWVERSSSSARFKSLSSGRGGAPPPLIHHLLLVFSWSLLIPIVQDLELRFVAKFRDQVEVGTDTEARRGDTRVEKGDVEPAEAVHGGGDRRLVLLGLTHIAGDEDPADLLRHLGEAVE